MWPFILFELKCYIEMHKGLLEDSVNRWESLTKAVVLNNEWLDLSLSSTVTRKGILRKLLSCTNEPWRSRRPNRRWCVRKHHLLTHPAATRSACEAPPSYLTPSGDLDISIYPHKNGNGKPKQSCAKSKHLCLLGNNTRTEWSFLLLLGYWASLVLLTAVDNTIFTVFFFFFLETLVCRFFFLLQSLLM